MSFQDSARRIADALVCGGVPRQWDGRKAIMEMKDGGNRHWRQMEWIGFYFQFLCEKTLPEIMAIPGPSFGNCEFDGFLEAPWDFKAHAINTSSHSVIVNDREAIERGVEAHGYVGALIALGEVTYNDDARTFKQWHDELKGGKSAYEKARIARGAWSRKRKVAFQLQQICALRLTPLSLARTGAFQRDFRNADGSARREKILVNLEKLAKTDALYFDW